MDKHNKHSKNKNKGVNKPQSPAGSGSALPTAPVLGNEAVTAAKPQPKTTAARPK